MSMQKSKASASRRDFIKRLGGGALAVAVGTAASERTASAQGPTQWASTYDWICVGSGVGGLAATIRGHDLGMKTLLLEKMDKIGGITSQACSGGGWSPISRWQKMAGIQDSREKALAYLRLVGGGYAKQEYGEAFVNNSARVFEYLHDKGDVERPPLSSSPGGGFYDQVSEGAGVEGRSAGLELFPSDTLGAWRDKVQLPIWIRTFAGALGVWESCSSGPTRTNERQLEVWKKRLGSQKFEALLKQDEDHRSGGAGYVGYLFRAVLKRGIEARVNAEVVKLIEENGRVVGVVVNQNGRMENIRANKGVLLALGNSMLAMDVGWGPGWMLAAKVDAKIHSEPHVIALVGIAAPGEVYPNGKRAFRINYERFMQHSVVVNRFGERFEQEAFYGAIGTKRNVFDDWPEHRFRNTPNFQVFDGQLLEKYAFAGMPPGHTEPRDLEWVAQGNTLAEVARKLDISAKGLEATVARFNEFARQGKDLDFGRDPKTMGAVEKPPFYGVQNITPDPFEMMLTTVETNTKGQALHYQTEKPIPGLYCCGALLNTSRIWGVGYQGGMQLGAGTTFGFLAAEHAVAAA